MQLWRCGGRDFSTLYPSCTWFGFFFFFVLFSVSDVNTSVRYLISVNKTPLNLSLESPGKGQLDPS